jgi:hypothetical protein
MFVAPPQNHYYVVERPFQLNVDGELEPAGYYGASQILRAKRVPMWANKGDQIHSLVGGSFLIRNTGNEAVDHWEVAGEITSSDPEKGVFEKSYGDTRPRWEVPDGALREIPKEQAERPEGGYRRNSSAK